MTEIPDEILQIVKEYINNIETNDKIPILEAFLFGSYARGGYNELSDIGIALVSEKFEGVRILDKDKIRKTTVRTDYRLSPFPFRPEDFTDDDFFVKEIKKTGIKLI
jgi:uncharacterized protein